MSRRMNWLRIAAALVFVAPWRLAEAEEMSFWSPPAITSECSRIGGGDKLEALPTQRRIYGNSSKRNKATNFVSSMAKNIARSVASPWFDERKFAAAFMAAVDAGAFTEPDFEGPGGASPIYSTSLVLTSAAYAFEVFDASEAWRDSERQRAVAWGDRLDRNHAKKYEHSSPDSLAAIGVARMAWGAATGQRRMFDRGVAEIKRVAALVRGAPKFEDSLRDNNEDVAHLILAAEVGLRNGLDIYSWSLDGFSLHEIIDAHAKAMLRNGFRALRERDTGDKRSILRPSGYSAHVAWIPIYLSRFKGSEAGQSVLELHGLLRSKEKKMYWGVNLGGPTECLWGTI